MKTADYSLSKKEGIRKKIIVFLNSKIKGKIVEEVSNWTNLLAPWTPSRYNLLFQTELKIYFILYFQSYYIPTIKFKF